MRFQKPGLLAAFLLVAACATVEDEPDVVTMGSGADVRAAESFVAAQIDEPVLKRKIAVGRFSNSTRYGKALLFEADQDPIADQASDMLMTDLIASKKFLVFERPDLGAVLDEQRFNESMTGANLIGVDAVIVGSVTELGRKTVGKVGFLSSTKKQVVTAKVELRLVDVKTGLAFYSGTGTGTASTEAGEIAGFGSRAAYDATLNDKAIGAAISDLMTNIINRLDERTWFTDILEIRDGAVVISGGPSQGLKVGDRFAVERQGKTMKSKQTGMDIQLPGERIAEIEVTSFFGADEFSQGAVARVVSGTLTARTDVSKLRVIEP